MAVLVWITILFRYVPWLAWPLTIGLVGLVVWGVVKRKRRRAKQQRPVSAAATLAVSVPFGPEDTVDSIALKLIEAASRRGQRVSVAEARRVAEVELGKARGERA
ncbi:hypothetical protein SCMU_27850 [Sinomonas cyclohexanicum]|uniref:Uncharacterized protein n=1 Tax=Sinomonas cyclohexanicum TaxID=322009 RepID=A0ABN6FM95_SINCY|nr:hypothetical protein SCMU_27850 [Corynebacterium cyclohexanicum]